jgi:LPXTG-motif cell wall-anchored protein
MSDQPENDNPLEGFEESPAPAAPSQPSGNRSFLIGISVIGGIFVLALVILVGYLLTRPSNGTAANEAARINLENTRVAQSATDQSRAIELKATIDAAKEVTNTPIVVAGATSTPVVAVPTATLTPQPTSASTQAKTQSGTSAPGTPVSGTPQGTKPVGGGGTTPGAGTAVSGTPSATALPSTGFADQVVLPMMAGGAVLLLFVIFIARRARLSGG